MKNDTTLTPEQEAARKAAAAPQTEQEKEAANKSTLVQSDREDVSQGFATDEGKKAQIEQELKAQQDRSKANEEGQAKVQERIEEMHKDNKAEQIAGDGENNERKVPDNPTSGLEHNRNTPRVDKDGNKHWD